MPLHKTMMQFKHLINGAAFAVGVGAVFSLWQVVEPYALPVKDLKKIEALEVRGKDVWVYGEFRKLRSNCTYIPPVRGTDITTGANLYIVSNSKTAGQNWQSDNLALDFGPWVVYGMVGKRFRLYQEYRCAPFPWSTFDQLFEIDATDANNITYRVLK